MRARSGKRGHPEVEVEGASEHARAQGQETSEGAASAVCARNDLCQHEGNREETNTIRECEERLGAICGLICFNLQATDTEEVFLDQFLRETSGFMFEVARKFKHGV